MLSSVRSSQPAALAILCLTLACEQAPPGNLDIATTTSVQNSGLLGHLLPIFERTSGITVRVHAAGSGRALAMLADGLVDGVISHGPETEQRLLPDHADWSYRKIAHNWFVVAGPVADPAGVRKAGDVVDAFQRIARSSAMFVSRGDESGTHERERSFWAIAGRQPSGGRLIVSGRGMAQALRHADEAQGYILTDAPTFHQLRGGLDLEILFEKDARLVNAYAIVHRSARAEAATFAAWLTSAEGGAAIGAFTIDGQRAFVPWPAGCAGRRPTDLPCP